MFYRKMKGEDYYSVFRTIILALMIIIIFLPRIATAQKRTQSVYFEGTDHELHVYRIDGETPGKTLLLIGGIQGNEPGGFLAADLYADFSLEKGHLIVVPRANFHSIVLNRRQINEDMNRKFAEDQKENYETKVVTILKELIAQSDCLLNLHDGSGFYSEKWESPDRNPKRYGQSIIADCETYLPEDREPLYLGEMARDIAVEINKQIKNTRHYFHFNNHNTMDTNSLHKEQRKSATYYALYQCGIPAFGIETSKTLPLEMKVRHHIFAINAFMKSLDIIPETPGIYLHPPALRYLVLSINDSLPILVVDKQTVSLKPGDTVTVSHIEANYERGLSADFLGIGTINDLRKKIKIEKPTSIIVRKDYYSCGTIYITLDGTIKKVDQSVSVSGSIAEEPSLLFFQVKVNGDARIAQNYGHIKLVRGDRFEIEEVVSDIFDPSHLVVNFKGFVGNTAVNIGEDRGYVIDTAKDLWKNYSLHKKGKLYRVLVTHKGGQKVGELFVDLEDPVLKYMILQMGDETPNCFAPGDTVLVKYVQQGFRLIDIITNVKQNSGIEAVITGPGAFNQLLNIKETVAMSDLLKSDNGISPDRYRIDVRRDAFVLGSIFVKEFGSEE